MSPATTGSPEVARKIRALETEFARIANEKDAAALTEMFYAADAQLLPPNAPLTRGRAEIRAFWTAFMEAAGTDVTLEAIEVGEAGDLAYAVGRYGATIQGARQTGKYLALFRRQSDGGYKCIADAFNADA